MKPAKSWQHCDITNKLKLLKCQQEHKFIAQGVELNVTHKGDDYYLMWSKGECCSTGVKSI
jgi:hypothetical protein